MRFKKYITEMSSTQIKKTKEEIKKLKQSKKIGKLTPAGKKQLERLENMLIKAGVFNF